MRRFNISKIRILIKRSGISQEDASEAIGVSIGTIKNAMKGMDIKISTVEKICDYFNVDPTYFLEGEEATSASTQLTASPAKNPLEKDTLFEQKDREIALLQTILEEKERTIQILLNK